MSTERSRKLAYLLRHDTTYVYDELGWRTVENLIEQYHYSMPELQDIVDHDEKGRYEFDQTHTKIRARQGHSVVVDVELEEKIPPVILYHGTSSRFINRIKKEGIKKMTRLYVQLTTSINVAEEVAKRHGGKTIILVVNTYMMSQEKHKFFLSRNGVWLTEYVEPKYFEIYKK